MNEVPVPEPGAGQILMTVTTCGICGGDLKFPETFPAGVIMGHEFFGTVAAVGEGVAELQIGDRIVELQPSCEKCVHCLTRAPERSVGRGVTWGFTVV